MNMDTHGLTQAKSSTERFLPVVPNIVDHVTISPPVFFAILSRASFVDLQRFCLTSSWTRRVVIAIVIVIIIIIIIIVVVVVVVIDEEDDEQQKNEHGKWSARRAEGAGNSLTASTARCDLAACGTSVTSKFITIREGGLAPCHAWTNVGSFGALPSGGRRHVASSECAHLEVRCQVGVAACLGMHRQFSRAEAEGREGGDET